MSQENKTYTYNSSQVFKDTDGTIENAKMHLPEEISQQIGLQPGDTVRIRVYKDSEQIEIRKVDSTDAEQ